MTIETSTNAPADTPVESVAPNEVNEQQLETTATSGANGEVQNEKEIKSDLTDVLASKIDSSPVENGEDKIESSPVDNGENKIESSTVEIVENQQAADSKDSEPAADAKEAADAAASAPATPSKNADDSTITRIKRSISESEEPTVPAKVLKI